MIPLSVLLWLLGAVLAGLSFTTDHDAARFVLAATGDVALASSACLAWAEMRNR